MTKKLSLLFVLMLSTLMASAYDAQVDGVYYNLIAEAKQAEVTSGDTKYTGSVTIPESFTYNGVTYSVTSIGNQAFELCWGLTSITIPNSVTSIGNNAFAGCSGLTSVIIPNSVTSIGEAAFSGCYFEKKNFINNSSLNAEANNYWGATIVDSRNDGFVIKDGTLLKYTGNDASVTIPNSVTSIGDYAFTGCYNLTSIEIPNSVTSIGNYAFSGCSGLTSVTIPNSVTSIGEAAFSGCSGLTSITIPNSVTSIGSSVFSYCSGLTSVISLIENPFAITGKTSDSRTFTENTFNNATLYVPKGTIEKYKATDGWKDFVFMEEGEGGGDTPETQKCSTPTITYENGKLTFDCETEGVEYVSSITPPSAFNSGSKTVSMPTTYKVTVYATKEGYENSDVATKEINVGGTMGIKGDVNEDGQVNGTDIQEVINIIVNAE